MTLHNIPIHNAYTYDLQGNIVGVYNSSTNTLEQFTDYYPYGLPHASATAPTVNRRKYGAKELTADLGLNLYDFAARFQNPAFPAFTTPDPLADTYLPFSIYLYCGGDPVNLVDPSGMKFKNTREIQQLSASINDKIDDINNTLFVLIPQLANQVSNNEDYTKALEKINSLFEKRHYLQSALNDIELLEKDENYLFSLSLTQSGDSQHTINYVMKGEKDKDTRLFNIYIMASGYDTFLHEIAHIRQALLVGGLRFDSQRKLRNAGFVDQDNPYKKMAEYEIEAYRIQYSYSIENILGNYSHPNAIDINYLMRILDENGRPIYNFIDKINMQ